MIVDLLSGVGVSRHIGQTCCHNFVRRVSIHSQKVNRKCEGVLIDNTSITKKNSARITLHSSVIFAIWPLSFSITLIDNKE